MFVASFDFGSLEIDNALRLFLQAFRLPGEAQKIDRLMESFAKALFAANPEPFANSDAAYVLAFAIIMLNTDLHNPSIVPEKKMTIDQFVSNNRGINNGGDLPRPFLERIYESIKSNEIKMSDEEIQMSRESWRKQGGAAEGLSQAVLSDLTNPSLRASLFGSMAPSALTAMQTALTKAESRDAVASALDGYTRCARIAAAHKNNTTIDSVLTALAAASSLAPTAAAVVSKAAAAAAAADPRRHGRRLRQSECRRRYPRRADPGGSAADATPGGGRKWSSSLPSPLYKAVACNKEDAGGRGSI